MTKTASTLPTDASARLDRLEHLCAHLDHMLSEALTLTEEASVLCKGAAKDTIQRAGASLVIAMEFREMIIDQVEALSGCGCPKQEAVA